MLGNRARVLISLLYTSEWMHEWICTSEHCFWAINFPDSTSHTGVLLIYYVIVNFLSESVKQKEHI